MRTIGLVSFCVTTCVLVAAALHHLEAGKEQVAKLGDPELDRFTLGSAKVMSAAATAPAGAMELGVLVLGTNGSEGDRVQTPPIGVAFKTLKLEVKDGIVQTYIAVPLKGAMATQFEPFSTYQVLVGPKAAIAKLERLRNSSHLVGEANDEIPSLNNAGSAFFSAWWSISSEEIPDDELKTSPFTSDSIARVDTHVRPTSDAIALTIPPTHVAAEPFTAMVTVTNPSRRKMTGLEV